MTVTRIFEGPDNIEDSAAPWDDTVRQDFHVSVFRDRYPCTPGHLLFVPRYNSLGVLNQAFDDAMREGQRLIEEGYCEGFNIGLNYGEVAGQTVPWPHIHLIPRRKGDVEDPVGGVRHTIPGRGNYRTAPKGTWPWLDEER